MPLYRRTSVVRHVAAAAQRRTRPRLGAGARSNRWRLAYPSEKLGVRVTRFVNADPEPWRGISADLPLGLLGVVTLLALVHPWTQRATALGRRGLGLRHGRGHGRRPGQRHARAPMSLPAAATTKVGAQATDKDGASVEPPWRWSMADGGLVIDGATEHDYAGSALAVADLDHDGRSVVAIGTAAPGYNFPSGPSRARPMAGRGRRSAGSGRPRSRHSRSRRDTRNASGSMPRTPRATASPWSTVRRSTSTASATRVPGSPSAARGGCPPHQPGGAARPGSQRRPAHAQSWRSRDGASRGLPPTGPSRSRASWAINAMRQAARDG